VNRIIKEGDYVNIFFDTTECEYGVKVLYTPVATGDCFHLERDDGTLIYVMCFTKMVRPNIL
jgi:hypothetical protein